MYFKITTRTFLFLTLAMLCIAPPAFAERIVSDKQSLQFGMLPYLSTHKLIKVMKPMKQHLESALKREVVLVTAPDFKTYIQRTLAGEYDIYHTAPHFAALAESENQHHRLGGFSRILDGTIIVNNKHNISSIDELRNKTLATPDKLAIISMLGESLMKSNGLVPGKTITIRDFGSHNGAILSVANGKSTAAVASAAVFEKMPEHVKSRLTMLTKTSKVPHAMIMARDGLPKHLIAQLRNAILDFTADGPGKLYFETTGQGNMQKITDEHMNTLRPYVDLLKKRIQ